MCALFFPALISVAVWMLLYGEPYSRGQITIQSLIALMTLVALNLTLAIACFSR
jgi:hypothetical protein